MTLDGKTSKTISMTIGFDGKKAVDNTKESGNYPRLVVEQLALEYPDNTLLLYTPKDSKNPRLAKIRSLQNVEFRFPAQSGLKGSLWRTFGVTNNLRPDGVELFHGLSNELPLNIASAGIPSVVTIHDVIYRRIPESHSFIDRLLYDYKYGHSCRNATRIIALSERTKLDVMEFYGIDAEKIDVVYPGCDDSFSREIPPEKLAETKKRLNLPERYILQVGTIENRRNLEASVRALSALPEDVTLLAIGRQRQGYLNKVMKIAEETGVARRVMARHDIPFADLPAVNTLAEAISYPSRYEGFGVPVLEALSCGRPVVAARGSSLEEAGGKCSFYVSSNDPRELAQALNSILDGSADVETITAEGRRHAAKFNSHDIASAIMTTYDKAIRDFGCR